MSSVVVPKLITLNNQVLRDQLTLILLKKQDPAVNWSRWNGVVTSVEDYKYWAGRGAHIVGIIITEFKGGEEDVSATLTELEQITLKGVHLYISESAIAHRPVDYWTGTFSNLIVLDDLIDYYSFIKDTWDGTIEDAITLFAMIYRYNRVVDCRGNESRLAEYDGKITFEFGIQPQKVWLVTQYFHHKDYARHQEIKECLIRNMACPYVDKIILLNETDLSKEWSKKPSADKVEQVVMEKRLTYADFIRYVQDNVPQNTFVILCNADIFVEDSLTELWKINMSDKMFALLRWDVDTRGQSKLFGPRADSQDSWIFLSDSIKNRKWDYSKFDFQLGQPGCDNAFAAHILRNKFLLLNPAATFKTFHLHNTNIRNYTKKDTIRSDVYINLVPSYIVDMTTKKVPSRITSAGGMGGKDGESSLSHNLVSFEVKSSSISNEITYCTMLEKEGRYKWEPTVENHYFQASIPIYTWKDACVTPNGLVYDIKHTYEGNHASTLQYNYWSNTSVRVISTLRKRKKIMAIPFKTLDIFKNPDIYILYYISRCLRLLELHPDACFWMPREFTQYLQHFAWKTDKLHVIALNDDMPCWGNEVVGFLPSPEYSELGSEDITALRSLLPSWREKPGVTEGGEEEEGCEAEGRGAAKICTVVLGQQITQQFIQERLTPFLREKGEEWTIRFVDEDHASYDAMLGASLCIFVGGKNTASSWSKLWALPRDCCVVEFQQELQIDGEFQHLAHVAGFKSWVLLLSKGSVADVQDQIMEGVEKWFRKNEDELFSISQA